MGKKQHQKDKLYLTCTEWKTLYGGKKVASEQNSREEFRRLPFHHCALSLQTFENPYCTQEGVIYDLMSIMPFIKKYGIDPATGRKLEAKNLIQLNFKKNKDGRYHCPVLYKVFNENSHIVAIKKTGNVFSYEAVEQLNLKNKNYKDLLTDVQFARSDILTIQDPNNLEKFNLTNFHHLRNNLKVGDDEDKKAKSDRQYYLKTVAPETKIILDELYKEYIPEEKKEEIKPKADKVNAAHYSTGAVAASLTSTTMMISTNVEAAVLEDDEVRYKRIKKKGYVRVQTNMGPLNFEIHCDQVPKTSENFIRHCKNNYYNNTKFHRSIRNFIIQGGDPEGTGNGGQSIWGKPFEDEFKTNLSHQGRGILSMANSGPNTNKSQFFITFRSCKHLDKKHSVFGRVVGGLETIKVMEDIETDNKDLPIEKIKILSTTVFVDPYEEVDKEIEEERQKIRAEAEEVTKPSKKETYEKPKALHNGVAKYLNLKRSSPSTSSTDESSGAAKKRFKQRGFDFSGWK